MSENPGSGKPVTQRLYDIQLNLKKRKLDRIRKREEAKKLKSEYAKQTEDFMVANHVAAMNIWTVIYIRPGPSWRSIFTTKYGTVTVPFEDEADIVCGMTDLNKDPAAFLEPYVNSNDNLTHVIYLMICALFNFFWSTESTTRFVEFVDKVPQSVKARVCECLLVHPVVQLYFKTVLVPVFDQISKQKEFKDMILTSLKDNLELLPSFLREILRRSSDMKRLFWSSFLQKFINFFFLFGIGHPELTIYAKNELEMMNKEMEAFFSTDEGDKFVRELVNSNVKSLCREVKESALLEVVPSFRIKTCINSNHLEKLHVEFKLPDGALMLVPFGGRRKSADRASRLTTVGSDIISIAKMILMQTDLMRLQEERPTVFDYFEQISDLSLTGGPDIESLLDTLADELKDHPMSIEEICDGLEASIHEDFLNADGDDSIEKIAPYSSQYTYINKLLEMVDDISKNAVLWIDFSIISASYDNICQTLPPPTDPSEFCRYMNKVISAILKDSSARLSDTPETIRCLYSIAMHKMGILEYVDTKEDVVEMNTKIHKLLIEKREDLLEESCAGLLKPFRSDPSKLEQFTREFKAAFETRLPFRSLEHIYTAYQMLIVELQMIGVDEIGADQIVPLAMTGAVFANPEGVWTKQFIFDNYIAPNLGSSPPIEPPVQYALIQFSSTCKFLSNKLK